MSTTNFSSGRSRTESYKELLCSPSLVGGLQQQLSICFVAVDILLSITAFFGNSLILASLYKESSLHPPSKLLYRCLATTDLLVGLVAQPLDALCWISVVQEHWSLCRYARDAASTTRLFKWIFLSPYNLYVQLPSYIILPGNIIRIIHKDFLHSQVLPSTSTRSTAAEPNKCTEHGTIQKGSVQCTVGAVSISCLLCTNMYSEYCDRSYQKIFISPSRHM